MPMHFFKTLVLVLTLAVSLPASAGTDSDKLEVKDFKVTGDPRTGSVQVALTVSYTPPNPGVIVFLFVAAGRDEPQLIGNDVKGTFDGKVPTRKTWASLKNTQGDKPIPIRVYACLTYDEKQARAWIRNHAAEAKTVHRLLP